MSPLKQRYGLDDGQAAAAKTPVCGDPFMAVRDEDTEMLQKTLDSGGKTARDKLGCTPLHVACSMGWHRGVELLLKANAVVDADDLSLYTPLHHAAIAGHTRIARLLIACGSKHRLGERTHDPRAKNGCTPLHLAASYGAVKVIDVLLQSGAAINSRTKEGATPLHYAASNGQEHSARRLLKQSANVNLVDDNNSTPLHQAAFYGHSGIAKILLAAGSDPSLADGSGFTASSIAKASRSVELIKIFSGNVEPDDNKSDTLDESTSDLFDVMSASNEAEARQISCSLRSNTTLRSLDLSGSSFGMHGATAVFKSLAVNRALRKLVVAGALTTVDNAEALASAIASNVTLHELDISSATCGPLGLRCIGNALLLNTTIATLSLCASIRNAAEAQEIFSGIQGNTGIENLDVRKCRFAGKLIDLMSARSGMRALGKVLRKNRTLRELNLAGSLVTAEDAIELADALAENSTLTSLDITDHTLNIKACRPLIETLKKKANIHTLKVEPRFGTSLENARKLAEAVSLLASDDISLTSLSLDDCVETESDAMCIAQGIMQNSTLTSLSLQNGVLGIAAAKQLFNALNLNTTLTALNLSGCLHTDEEIRYLSDCLTTNHHISFLSIRDCFLSETGVALLAEGLRSNNSVTRLRCDASGQALKPFVYLNEKMLRDDQATQQDYLESLFESIKLMKFSWISRILRRCPQCASVRNPSGANEGQLAHTLVLRCKNVHEPTLLELFRVHFELDAYLASELGLKSKAASFERCMIRLASENWKDADGNTVLHRILLACQLDTLSAVNARNISARLVDINPEYSTIRNSKDLSPAEISTLCPDSVLHIFIPQILRLVANATRKKVGSQGFTEEGVVYTVGPDGFIREKSVASKSLLNALDASASSKTSYIESCGEYQSNERNGDGNNNYAADDDDDDEAPMRGLLPLEISQSSSAQGDEASVIEVEPLEHNGKMYLLDRVKRKVYDEDNGDFVGRYEGSGEINFEATDSEDEESDDDTDDDETEDTSVIEVERLEHDGTAYLLERSTGDVYDENGSSVVGTYKGGGAIDFHHGE